MTSIYLRFNPKTKRKGNAILDTLFFIVILFASGLIFIVGNIVQTDLNQAIQNDTDLGTEAKEVMSDNTARYPSLFDNGFLLLFVLFWIMLLVASFNIDAHPIFFVISLILLIFVVIVAMTLGNTFQDVVADADIQPYADNFPIINYIIGNLAIISVIVGFSVLIVLYGKMRSG